jgi:fucose permease
MIIIGSLFFIFGFVTWLNSVLIPYLRIACQLNNFESYFVAFAFYIAYLVMAIPSALILKHTGFKKGMSLGLLIMATGALIFIPAALTRTYALFLLGLFVQGTGLAVLQSASNPYVTIMGPQESAARRISMMGICIKIAGAIAPIILGTITLKDADIIIRHQGKIDQVQKIIELDALARRVILPYIAIIIVLSILATLIYLSKLPEVDLNEINLPEAYAKNKIYFSFPFIARCSGSFLYVGVEVLAGDTIINYAAYHGISP